MAAEALRARRGPTSCGQVERQARAQATREALCARCGGRAPGASGHHHELQCGHAFCERCLLVTEEYSTIICPDCEVATTINTKQGYCPIDGYIKEESFMEKLQPKKIKNCSQDFKKTADRLTVGLEHSAFTRGTVLNPSAVMEETKTVEEIDEALKIAGQNFEELSIAVKMLEPIHSQTKEETVSLIEVLEKQFDQLFTSLDSRLNMNCGEIICMFNTMGKIEFEDSTKCDPQENEIGQNVLKNNNHKKEFACSRTQPSLKKKKFDISVLTNEAPPTTLRWETNNVHLEAKNFQPQKEIVATTSPKTTAALPQMGSSPDVIIEEIIEENLEIVFLPYFDEACCTDYLTETPKYQKKPLQKKSPFGSKAGSPELVFVSHVIHPCHFYIRKYSQIKDATVLEKKVQEYLSTVLKMECGVEELLLN
ncbi:RING finger protein 17-like isoform X4 [Vicugna pacos]|uniref:RING finger protein 17-like isoform X4 n=1 Tax=Vicugna pacos TaxID=30538 RepID=A0ABM5CYT4_VICPA